VRRVRTGQRLLLTLGLMILGPALAADLFGPNADPKFRPQLRKFESPQALDAATQELHHGIWELYSGAYFAGTDVRGRTVRDDLDEWVLTPARAQKIAALESQARVQEAGHDQARMRTTLSEAATLFEVETYRVFLLGLYWSWQNRIGAHATNFDKLAALLSQDETAAARPPLDAEVRTFAGQLTAGIALTDGDLQKQATALQQLEDTAQRVLRAYNDQRAGLALVYGRHEREAHKPPLARVRATPCPEATLPAAGNSQVKVLGSKGDLEEFYPAAAKHDYFEGSVVVEVAVSAAGCAESAAVYDTSGVQSLDEAAVNYVLTACRFRPAAVADQAVAASLLMRIKFKLSNPPPLWQ
jgi:TonB family protein